MFNVENHWNTGPSAFFFVFFSFFSILAVHVQQNENARKQNDSQFLSEK